MSSKKPKKKRKRVVIQNHHISYDPEWTVTVYKGEHQALTLLNLRNIPSQGCLTALKAYIIKFENIAITLHKE